MSPFPWAPLGAIALVAGAWLFLWRLRRDTLAAGAERERSDTREKVLDDVDKANDARDRLRRDAGYARRLRDRFTRKA